MVIRKLSSLGLNIVNTKLVHVCAKVSGSRVYEIFIWFEPMVRYVYEVITNDVAWELCVSCDGEEYSEQKTTYTFLQNNERETWSWHDFDGKNLKYSTRELIHWNIIIIIIVVVHTRFKTSWYILVFWFHEFSCAMDCFYALFFFFFSLSHMYCLHRSLFLISSWAVEAVWWERGIKGHKFRGGTGERERERERKG